MGRQHAISGGHPGAAQRAGQQARDGVRKASPWLEPLGRAGFVAKGLVYLLIGVLAAQAALGAGGVTPGSRGVLLWVADLPLGQLLLVLIAIGMLGYALWRFIQAFMDPDNKGSDAKGYATRTAFGIVGAIHVGLALSAARIAVGSGGGGGGSGGGGGDSSQEWTAWLLSQPFGRWLVGLVGAIVVAAALHQFYQAYSAKFRQRLKTGEMSRRMIRGTLWIGRVGFAARGVVFGVIGGFLLVAAWQADPSDARGLGGALRTLSEQGVTNWLFAVIALGLAAYGVFMLFLARYRRMLIT